jgi:hypothetical protein
MIALLSLLLAQVDLPSWVIAGHGYDFGGPGSPREQSEVADEDGGIGTQWIVAALLVGVITVGALVALDPSGALRKVKAVGPRGLIVLLIAAPLVAWTASAGGDDDPLTVERAFDVDGKPELLVALGDDELNTLEMTNGKREVRVECVGRDGKVVVASPHDWPFVDEIGFEDPHAHQPGSRDQVERVDLCRLLGTSEELEAEVKGVLSR